MDSRKVTLQERFIGNLSRILGPFKHYLPQFSQVGQLRFPSLGFEENSTLLSLVYGASEQ